MILSEKSKVRFASLLNRASAKITRNVDRVVRLIDPLYEWKLSPLSPLDLKYLCIQDLFLKSPPGTDVLECGVGAGYSLELILRLCASENRKYFGFDSFEGFPDGTIKDNFFRSESRSVFRSFTKSYLLSQLRSIGCSENLLSRISFIKGYLPGSLVGYAGAPGFAYLDLDLYESYLQTLRSLYPRMVKGGIILIDEYDSEADIKQWPGAKLAVDEFCLENNVNLSTHWTGRKYIVKH